MYDPDFHMLLLVGEGGGEGGGWRMQTKIPGFSRSQTDTVDARVHCTVQYFTRLFFAYVFLYLFHHKNGLIALI
jgi:hypothetical protein